MGCSPEDHTDWCYSCERHHCSMDYGDGCVTDAIIAEDNAERALVRLLAGPTDFVLRRQCHARLKRRDAAGDGHFGRCELKRHAGHVDHALERGMYWVRWAGDDAAVSGTYVTS